MQEKRLIEMNAEEFGQLINEFIDRDRYAAQITAAAVDGHGVAVGRSALLGDDLRAGRLVRPFSVARKGNYAYYLVSPEAIADRPRVAAFRNWLLEVAERDQMAM